MNRYPEAYIEYLAHFHGSRDFFECHEILEEYWKKHPGDPHARTYVGLIQIAVGLYHHRRGNLAGACKMLRSSLEELNPAHVHQLGLDAAALQRMIERRLLEMEERTAYADLNLPIEDSRLLTQCEAACSRMGIAWNTPSDVANDELVHRHKLRDRTDVIRERLRQKQMREEQRSGTE